ncbi:hypothetical protein L1887_63288 [Cichorium endivia]|nr:hypothetical protein L1887_63288 [Cichorium endivia]
MLPSLPQIEIAPWDFHPTTAWQRLLGCLVVLDSTDSLSNRGSSAGDVETSLRDRGLPASGPSFKSAPTGLDAGSSRWLFLNLLHNLQTRALMADDDEKKCRRHYWHLAARMFYLKRDVPPCGTENWGALRRSFPSDLFMPLNPDLT